MRPALMRCAPFIFPRIGAAVRALWRPVAGGALGLLLLAGCQNGPKVTIDWQGGPFFAPQATEPGKSPLCRKKIRDGALCARRMAWIERIDRHGGI